MDKTLIQKLKDAIAKSSSIGIAVGHNPPLMNGAALSFISSPEVCKKERHDIAHQLIP